MMFVTVTPMPGMWMNALTTIPESSIGVLTRAWTITTGGLTDSGWLGKHKDPFHSNNLSLFQICLSNWLELCHYNESPLGQSIALS